VEWDKLERFCKSCLVGKKERGFIYFEFSLAVRIKKREFLHNETFCPCPLPFKKSLGLNFVLVPIFS